MSRKKGSSLVELGAGLIVLVPIFLYAVDYATIFFAQGFGANVCRDAARAAAAGPPTMFCPGGTGDPNRPRKRAERVIAKSSKTGAMIRVEPVFRFYETINDPVPIPAYGGPVNGTVRVRTETQVNPPFLLPYVSKAVSLFEEQTFPFTWVVPAGYTGAAGAGGVASLTRPSKSADSD